MATIIKTDAGTYKAIVRKSGEPVASKTFKKKGDVICAGTPVARMLALFQNR